MSVTSRSQQPFRVIDASAIVELLMVSQRSGAVERAVDGVRLTAPDTINPEVLQAIRGLERSGEVDADRAEQMLTSFLQMAIHRVPTMSLLAGAWLLRDNLSAYDGCYVALTRLLGSELITGDSRLARAPRLGVPLILV